MVRAIVSFWQDLPWIIRYPLDFIVLIILLRGVVAKDITSWLEDRGIIRTKEKGVVYHVLDFIYNLIRAFLRLLFIPTDRKRVIWNHHKEQHPAKSIAGCTLESCRI